MRIRLLFEGQRPHEISAHRPEEHGKGVLCAQIYLYVSTPLYSLPL